MTAYKELLHGLIDSVGAAITELESSRTMLYSLMDAEREKEAQVAQIWWVKPSEALERR